jgi:transcriptional regulator with XRE-family HTH domain
MNPLFVVHEPHKSVMPAVRELFVAMNEEKMTIAALARRSGVCEAAISKWKRGQTGVNYANLEACFNVLGFSLVPVPSKALEGA